MLKVGIVGLGVMGRTHFRIWASRDDVSIVAVCDCDPAAVTKAASGNLSQQSGDVDLTGIEIYSDFEDMLSDANLDAVSITLPTQLHAEFSIKALERGWHVLCEKPMSLDEDACNRMISAADASGKVLLVAQCIRFWPEYAWSRKAIVERSYGALRAANFYRISSSPAWGAGSWYGDPEKSGGVTLDLHIHDVDYIQHLLGQPLALNASGTQFENGMLSHIVTDFDYGPDKVITAEASWMMSQSYGFVMGFRIMLEGASLVYDSGRTPSFQVFPNEGEVFTPELAPGNGYNQEVAHFVDLTAGNVDSLITPSQARDSVNIVLAAARSAESKLQGNLQTT